MPSVVIPESHPLTDLIAAFLTDLANADRSVHTQRAYATELRRRNHHDHTGYPPVIPGPTPSPQTGQPRARQI